MKKAKAQSQRCSVGLPHGAIDFSERTFFDHTVCHSEAKQAAASCFGMAERTENQMDPWSFSLFDIKKYWWIPLRISRRMSGLIYIVVITKKNML